MLAPSEGVIFFGGKILWRRPEAELKLRSLARNANNVITTSKKIKNPLPTDWKSKNTADFAKSILLIKKQNNYAEAL